MTDNNANAQTNTDADAGDQTLLGATDADVKEGAATLLADAGAKEPAKDGAADGADEGAKGSKTEAPETYGDFTAPDGTTLDADAVAEFVPIAKELGLTQEAAQGLVSLQARLQAKADAKVAADFEKQQQAWQAEIRAIDGHDKLLANAKRALTLADPDMRSMIEGSWMGNHPGVIRFLAKVGERVSESRMDEGKGAAGQKDFFFIPIHLYLLLKAPTFIFIFLGGILQ